MLRRMVLFALSLWLFGQALAACSAEVAAPTADAGLAAQVAVGDLVQLDGSKSSDPDELPLHYTWSFLALPMGSATQLNDPHLVNPSFLADREGDYQVQLIVSNGAVSSDPATVTITAGPCGAQPPVIEEIAATPDAPGIGATVQLSAAVHDPDHGNACGGSDDGDGEEAAPGGKLAVPWDFRWRLIAQPAGSQARLNSSGVRNPSFVADTAGDYTVELVVLDETGLASGARLLTVTAAACGGATPAVQAILAEPAEPDVGSLVVLSATLHDPDNDDPCLLAQELGHGWMLLGLPPGSMATLNDPGVQRPSFVADAPGTYTVGLVVSDPTGRRSPLALLEVTASECHSAAPVVEALQAAPADPIVGSVVQLTARVSDPDNARPGCGGEEVFAYAWQLLALPAGSQAVLNAAGAENPSFSADLPGEYLVGLQVRDVTGLLSDRATLAIQVSPCGSARPGATVSFSPEAPAAGDVVRLVAEPSDADLDDPCGLSQSFTYRWTIVSAPEGSRAALNLPEARTPSFTADLPGRYALTLVVTDDTWRRSDVVVVDLEVSECGHHAPQVEAIVAAPAAPATGQVVQVTATVSDGDSDPDGCGLVESLAYRWSIEALPAGSLAWLNEPSAANPSFLADVPGSYLLALQVTDRFGLSSAAAVQEIVVSSCGAASPGAQVAVEPAAPITGSVVRLVATPVDADLEEPCLLAQSFSYRWNLVAVPEGSRAALNLPEARTPSFTADLPGEYALSLLVTDDTGLSSESIDVLVNVGACGSRTPAIEEIAVAPAAPGVGRQITLTPSVAEADNGPPCNLGQTLSYRWTFLAVPPGSLAQLNDAGLRSPSFVPDLAGSYELGLQLDDSTGRTTAATRTVVVAQCGAAAPVVEQIAAEPDAQPFLGESTRLVPRVSDADEAAGCGLVQELSYRWSFVELPLGSLAVLNEAQARTPSFTPDVAGSYVLRLVVTDATGRSSAPKFTTVVASGCGGFAPSIAEDGLEAEPSAQVLTGQPVLLRFTAGDEDMEEPCSLPEQLLPSWTLAELPPGSQAALNEPGADTPSFVPDVAGDYVVRLVVSDGSGLRSAPRTLTVSARLCGQAAPEVANVLLAASPPESGAVVRLSAVVHDADLDDAACAAGAPPQQLSYRWTLLRLPGGSRAVLNQPTARTPSFVADLPGEYAAELVVTDSTGRTGRGEAWLAIGDCGSRPPVVSDIGFGFLPESPVLGQPVTLSVPVSDPDQVCRQSERLTYVWRVVELPPGSLARLDDPGLAEPSFVPDLEGDYRFALTVTDSTGRSDSGGPFLVQLSGCGGHAPTPALRINPGNIACSNRGTVTLDEDNLTQGLIQLDAGQSSDADASAPCGLSQTLYFRWQLVAAPAGSEAQLSLDQARNPWFRALHRGDYGVRLFVSDGEHVSAPYTCTIRVID